ncbi:hypothetical protein IW146_010142 [Coemansia sp. RSA 922]|nr:hypothetical protein H4S04_004886 [Coemansia sp. S16]KAJ2082488.1 hypothetical protein GGI09_007487 [Coemansia sp. S100]KAJ2097634.1 hypothetical protein IW146_010142 [Coemansia sp. RSA 922]KAJ2427303.1 hypothetical protein GGF41_001734 [Coemansia sp. RSA 2531]
MDTQASNSEPSLEAQPEIETAKNLQICTLTVRIIKNFEFRVSKNIILQVDAARTTVGELKDICRTHIASDTKFKIFRTIDFNTLKIYTQAFGNKTQNLIINMGEDGFLLDDKATLEFAGIRNETELSFFNKDAYEAYVKSPVTKW